MPEIQIENEDHIFVEYLCDKCGKGTMETNKEFVKSIGGFGNEHNISHKCSNVECQEVNTFEKVYPAKYK